MSMIKTMPWDKTPGYDDISVNIIKDNINIRSIPLEKKYNQGFYSGTLPGTTKNSKSVTDL